MSPALQTLFVFLLLANAANATTPQPVKPAAVPPVPFTYCGPQVLKLVVDGKPIPPEQKARYMKCDPMLGKEASRQVSVEAASGRIVKQTMERDGTLRVTIIK